MAKAVCNQGQTKSLLEQLRPFPKTHAALKRFEDEYPQLFQHLIYDCKRFVYRSPYAMIPLVQATFKMRSTEVAKWLVAVDAPVIVASAQDDDMVPCVLQQWALKTLPNAEMLHLKAGLSHLCVLHPQSVDEGLTALMTKFELLGGTLMSL